MVTPHLKALIAPSVVGHRPPGAAGRASVPVLGVEACCALALAVLL